jgi:serine protease
MRSLALLSFALLCTPSWSSDTLTVKLSPGASARRVLAASLDGLSRYKVSRLFPRSAKFYREEREELERATGERLPRLESYRTVRFERGLRNDELKSALSQLLKDPDVETAYAEPRAENAVLEESEAPLATLSFAPTTDFQGKQFHLEAPPLGVNAPFAWSLAGGDGSLVRIIDIEWGWQTKHEDFTPPFWNKSGGSVQDHGTAVWGEVAAKKNGEGVTGIAHGAAFGVQAYSNASSYHEAGVNLVAGDILIIEQHAPGPDAGKWAPQEYAQANFDAFKILTAKGVLVIAAAGNGGSNLDSSAYKKAFDMSFRDSGAIMVGAGGPPGTDHLKRLSFSNYGSRVDAFAYGRSVVTAGYGDLFNGGGTRTYTGQFSGTSSATPIVVGAVAAIQSIAKSRGRLLSPAEVRAALRKTGTPQAGGTGQRIGNLPDIEALVKELGLDKALEP